MFQTTNGRYYTRNVFLWAQTEAIYISSCSVSRIYCVANLVMMVVTHCSTRLGGWCMSVCRLTITMSFASANCLNSTLSRI